MAHVTIYVGNDMLAKLNGLHQTVDDAYLNSKTVDITLYDSDRTTEIVGETWPLTLDYVGSSDGDYRATLKDTLTLTKGAQIWAEVNANAGPGLQGNWWLPVHVEYREK